MDKDQIKGKAKEAAGGVQKAYGRATGQERHVAEGDAKQVEGKVQGTFGKVKEGAKDLGDKAKRTAESAGEAIADATRPERTPR